MCNILFTYINHLFAVYKSKWTLKRRLYLFIFVYLLCKYTNINYNNKNKTDVNRKNDCRKKSVFRQYSIFLN